MMRRESLRLIGLSLAFSLLTTISAPAHADSKTIARCGHGFLEEIDGYKILHIKGNAYGKDVARLAKAQEFAARSEIAVLLVTHTRQMKLEQGEDWMSKVTGTTGIVGTADSIMFLDAQRGQPDGTLYVTGRDVQDRSDAVRRVGPWWQVFDGGATGSLGDRSVQIMDWVSEQRAPVNAQAVSDALDLPRATVDTYLGRLARAAKIQKVGRGQYQGLPIA